MTSTLPRPALVSQRAVQPLPRLLLLLLCAAYVIPGVFGRDPWRSADLIAFAQMQAMAEGHSNWLDPSLAGVATGAAALPHWLGACAILVLGDALGPALAARIPFALLLALALCATWYGSFHFARSDAAQPLPMPFGGEALPVDYARAMADGAVLSLIATLGLLQLGHETTPELAQLAFMASLLWALAVSPRRPRLGAAAALSALALLAASGAPMVALLLSLTIAAWAWKRPAERRLAAALLLGALLAVLTGWLLHAWSWRVAPQALQWPQALRLARLLLWFGWPALLLAMWTLWRWRRHLGERHLAHPLATVTTALLVCIAMGGSDRALLLALPGLAMLAAWALPTLQRSASAAIDWFSVFFFTVCAIAIWVIHVAVLTGVPAQPARNVAKLAPGFEGQAAPAALLIAIVATMAWAGLVRWRTRTHRPQIWKSLVLPAGGVALSWLLLNTLWLPMLDYARSQRPLIERLSPLLGQPACVAAPGQSFTLVAALMVHGRWSVDARPAVVEGRCPMMVRIVRSGSPPTPPAGWHELGRVQRPTDRSEAVAVYGRTSAP